MTLPVATPPAAGRKSDIPRTLILPPADRAYWPPAAGDPRPLLYLAWGERKFGTDPISCHRHHGWVYVLVEAGSPNLVGETKSEHLAAGTLVVLGPDCAFGWNDQRGRVSKLLLWMWRAPGHAPLTQLPSTALVRHELKPDERAELRQLHSLTRSEILRHDAHSSASLAGLQSLVETRMARLGERDPHKDAITRALRWIETHLATRQPLARLADYLGVSAATVHRLFRERLGTTVRQKIAEVRHQEAERLLASGTMAIKEIAYRLGYRHPHDFSRAYRNHSGVLPPRRAAGVTVRQARIKRPAATA